jgi:lysozyme
MADLKTRLKEYEGTIKYQKKLGYYRNDRFFPYLDSRSFPTIGYGRLMKRGDNYPNGISVDEAERMLDEDISTATNQLKGLNLDLPDDWNDFMIIMIFNVGITKVKLFHHMLEALKEKNYSKAIIEAKDSNWYKQVPNRVDSMIKALSNK